LDCAKQQLLDDLSYFPVLNSVIARVHLRQAFAGLAAFSLSRKRQDNKYFKIAHNALDYFKEAVDHSSLNVYPIFMYVPVR
jgi:hypothetical protein